jgi:hypothetical protein
MEDTTLPEKSEIGEVKTFLEKQGFSVIIGG